MVCERPGLEKGLTPKRFNASEMPAKPVQNGLPNWRRLILSAIKSTVILEKIVIRLD
jgi:hypothetical protein